jgi:large subunit ribosomal protein L15
MPLHRRIPKRGFHNKWATSYLIINLAQLASLPAGTVVDYDYVVEHSLAKIVNNNGGLKVLGGGEINVAITVKAAKFTESAKAAIEKVGGTAEIV